MLKRVLTILLLCTACMLSTLFLQSAPVAHAASAGTVYNCRVGYACIYRDEDLSGHEIPEHTYYYYGVYQLHNETGMHMITNNQYGGAAIKLCTDWNGHNFPTTVNFDNGGGGDFDLTPINSIVLTPTGARS
jgi:hypothetical protein